MRSGIDLSQLLRLFFPSFLNSLQTVIKYDKQGQRALKSTKNRKRFVTQFADRLALL